MILHLVFQNEVGFITDLGETIYAEGGATKLLPRYGVWKRHTSKGKPQVIFTTNNLDEAKAALRNSGADA
jgi:hypothetical protein